MRRAWLPRDDITASFQSLKTANRQEYREMHRNGPGDVSRMVLAVPRMRLVEGVN